MMEPECPFKVGQIEGDGDWYLEEPDGMTWAGKTKKDAEHLLDTAVHAWRVGLASLSLVTKQRDELVEAVTRIKKMNHSRDCAIDAPFDEHCTCAIAVAEAALIEQRKGK